jgi:hypothetical protein
MHADRVTDTVPFAHASEAELARILDYYGIGWEYEPRPFPILWNLEGRVVESFTPDFYLPDLDLYVELTTLKQSLVRKKNRKLRRLRELYPDVNIKLFYARDFRQLLLKYGRIGLLDSLSGAEGQSTPPRRGQQESDEPGPGVLPVSGEIVDPGPDVIPGEAASVAPAPGRDRSSGGPGRSRRRAGRRSRPAGETAHA